MKKVNLLSLILVGLLISIIDRSGFFNPVRGFFQNITMPIQLGLYRSVEGVKDKLSIFSDIASLRSQNTKLEGDNIELKSQIASLKKVQEENQVLKDQLGLKDKVPEPLKRANVLGFSPLGTTSRLLLDKGQKEGVKVGDFALVRNNFVGRIVSVTNQTSTLELLTDPDSKIPAQTETGAKGLLVGQFGSEARLTKVLQQETLKEGDLIMTLADIDIPKNLVLGKITQVFKNDREIFQEAKVEYLFPISKITEVFISSL